MTEIVPCKCGGKVGENWHDYPHIHKTIYWLSCEGCGKVSNCYDYKERDKAILAWNEKNTELVSKSQIVTGYETSMEGKETK